MSKDEIKGTNYGLVKTNKQLYGLIRGMTDDNETFNRGEHKD